MLMTRWIAIALFAAAAEAAAPYHVYSDVSEFTISVLVVGKNSLMYPSSYSESITLSSDLVGMNTGSLVGIPNGETTITVTGRGKIAGTGDIKDLYRGETTQLVNSGTFQAFVITLLNLNAEPTAANVCPFITSASVAPGRAVRHAADDPPNPSIVTYSAVDEGGAIANTAFTPKAGSATDIKSNVTDCGDGNDATYCFAAGADEALKEHEFLLAVTDNDAVDPCTTEMDINIEVIKRLGNIGIAFGLQPVVVDMRGSGGHTRVPDDTIDVTFRLNAEAGDLAITTTVACTGAPAVVSSGTCLAANHAACTFSLPYQGQTASQKCDATFLFTDVTGRVSDPIEYTYYSGLQTFSLAPHVTFAFVSGVDLTKNDTDFSVVVHVEDNDGTLTPPTWDCGDLVTGDGTTTGIVPGKVLVAVGSGQVAHYTYSNTVTKANTISPACTFTIERGGETLVKTFNFNTPYPASYPTPVPTPVATCTLSADACVHAPLAEVSGPTWAYVTSGHRPSSLELTAGSVIVIHTTEAVAFHASVPPEIIAALNACGEIEAHVESVTYDSNQNVRVMGINRLFYDDVWHNNTAIFTDAQLSDTTFRVVSAPLVSSGHVWVTNLCFGGELYPLSGHLLTVPEYNAASYLDEPCHLELGFNISRELVDLSGICHVGWIVHNDTLCDTSDVIGLPCDSLCVPYGSEYIMALGIDGRIQFYSDFLCSDEVPGKSLPVTGDLHNYVPADDILAGGHSHYALELFPGD